MSPLTRRQMLALGAAGAGAAAVGGAGLWWTSGGGGEALGGGRELVQPEVLSSRDGALDLALEAAPARVRIGARTAHVQAFNGSLPGPTLRVRGGDTLRVAMTNGLEAPTNLHVHGLHLSPEDNGDNPFVSIAPGDSFDYDFSLPDDHPPGTYWYHPHRHGHVADQLAAGLYGAIVVEDPDPVPVARERVLVVSDLTLDDSGNLAEVSPPQRVMGREGETVLVNGQVRPRAGAAPGERELWRVVNACPARYLRLTLDGQTLRLLGRDVGRLPEPVELTEVTLAPGNRVELLVDTREGASTLTAAPVDRGSMDGMMGGAMPGDGPGTDEPIELLTLEVTGDRAADAGPVPPGPVLRDLREEPVAARRTLDFAMGMGMGGMMGGMRGPGQMMSFTIDGRPFDAERTDQRVRVGTVEEWTLTNSSPMDHPMHLHVWPMQVVTEAGREVAAPRWLDVVNVPAFGEVTVRVAFDDFAGRTVYHCHILDHEDLGMMGTLEAR
ncbi:multicopper oxidase family protein [Kocuria marina]|uniref:Multicopper oxidase with three cupredoxin domains (Includes cell division protein FtsP and spore coat protein CotA) n=1 Tax=Kocuria marina subsp. indica TaxID=1049583 RepID=A0A1X7DKQ6_9MICC|nr:multicopper oxidase family protein [Kocuria indica]OXS82072.1 copper oxidase [Kocuria indica]RLP57376.1 multicopper oxidase family protein [Kocuria indica]SMF17303.1 Multicopper oxidase with three cupredoxin domains (includes cell division protein FtsP and spore coat protein CotA) [Kocuria indica]